MGGRGGPGRFREWVYGVVLRAYPRRFRERYGRDLRDAFRDAWREEGGGDAGSGARFWLRVLRHDVAGGLSRRFGGGRSLGTGPSGSWSAGPLTGLGRDARQAIRSFRRSPGFVAVVVVTLALGIGANTAVFSVLDQVLLRPLPYEEAGQLVRLYMDEEDEPGEDRNFVTAVHYDAYRERVSAFEELAALYTYAETGADLTTGERPERLRVLSVSSNYFRVYRQEPMLGRVFTREEELQGVDSGDGAVRSGGDVAVLSASLWRRHFGGDRSVIGERITLSGVPHTVVGVMPDDFEGAIAGAVDVWVPQDLLLGEPWNTPYNHFLTVVGRLRPGATEAQAEAQLAAVTRSVRETYSDADQDSGAHLVALHEDVVGGVRTMLAVLLGAVGLVLLIVCVNVANLFLVRSAGRGRELAVRSALGCSRLRLARQLLTESVILAGTGGLLGVLVARLAVDGLVALGADSIPRLAETSFDARVLGFTLAVSVATGLFFGVAPALRFSRPTLTAELREGSRGSGGSRAAGRLRSLFVVAQVALALMLLVGGGLLLASFDRLRSVELGVRTGGVLTFQVHLPDVRYDGEDRARFHVELADRVASLPGVRAAGAVSRLPVTGRYNVWGTRALTGPLAGEEEGVTGPNQRVVEGRYFEALGIPVLEGRVFDARDDADAPLRYVVNRRLAERLFPGANALGQRISAGGREGEIIGVVGNTALTPEGEMPAKVYHSHTQFADNRNWALTQVVAVDGDPASVLPAVRAQLAALDPELVLHRPVSLAEVLGQGVAQRRMTMLLMVAFAATALVLAALGIYGVLSYSVNQRRQEIGIRMALGARAREIVGSVLRRGLALAALGVAVGLVGALALGRWLQSLLFQIGATDPRVYATVTATVILTALLAGYLPARRATAVDPRAALSEE